jgi:hypothetical protein
MMLFGIITPTWAAFSSSEWYSQADVLLILSARIAGRI